MPPDGACAASCSVKLVGVPAWSARYARSALPVHVGNDPHVGTIAQSTFPWVRTTWCGDTSLNPGPTRMSWLIGWEIVVDVVLVPAVAVVVEEPPAGVLVVVVLAVVSPTQVPPVQASQQLWQAPTVPRRP